VAGVWIRIASLRCRRPSYLRPAPPALQYALWAEGLGEALRGVAAGLPGVPIYITETGCADRGDAVRPAMIESYMAQVESAVAEGIDLRGVMYWSIVDCFEWQEGYNLAFGLYPFDKASGRGAKPRASAALLKRWFERLAESAPRLRRGAAARAKGGGGEVADGQIANGDGEGGADGDGEAANGGAASGGAANGGRVGAGAMALSGA
jgi:hypothetical protein